MKNLAQWLILMLAPGFLAGCMVGPNYHRPIVQTPTAYRDLGEIRQAQAASYADLPSRQGFHDPRLQEHIRTALMQIYDIVIYTKCNNAPLSQLASTRS